jgi:hypothetical protein
LLGGKVTSALCGEKPRIGTPLGVCRLVCQVGKFGHRASLHSTAIQQILPVDKIDEFKEFHASEIYNGRGVFGGIDETKRLRAIHVLAVRMDDLPFICAAIDQKKFASSPFCTANPLLTAVHPCLLGIEDWATANHPSHPGTKRLDWNDTYLCIADDNKKTEK